MYCKSPSCEDINYDNSLYLSIKSSIYNITYAYGYYLLYAYDVGADGALLPLNNTMYAATDGIINLNCTGISRSELIMGESGVIAVDSELRMRYTIQSFFYIHIVVCVRLFFSFRLVKGSFS